MLALLLVPGTPAATRGGSVRPNYVSLSEWARANGHQVNERGRVAAGIVEAYDKAHA